MERTRASKFPLLMTAQVRIVEARDKSQMFELVSGAVLQVLPKLDPKRITRDAGVMETGIDSLKVIELTLALEESIGEPISLPEWLGSVDDPRQLTFGSLTDYLCAVDDR